MSDYRPGFRFNQEGGYQESLEPSDFQKVPGFDTSRGTLANLKGVPDKGARMYIAAFGGNAAEIVVAQFNPTELEEQIEVNYARQTVPGLSHQVLQYINTNNVRFTFELYFHAGNGSLAANLEARRRLESFCYPNADGHDVAEGGPPKVLFVWPNVVSILAVISSLEFKYTQFNNKGTPIAWTCRVALEEYREVRLLSDEVAELGTQRAPRGGGFYDAGAAGTDPGGAGL